MSQDLRKARPEQAPAHVFMPKKKCVSHSLKECFSFTDCNLRVFIRSPVISWILNSRKAESDFGTRYASNEGASLSYRPRRSVKFEVGTKTITDTSIDAIPGQNLNADSVYSHDNEILLTVNSTKPSLWSSKSPQAVIHGIAIAAQVKMCSWSGYKILDGLWSDLSSSHNDRLIWKSLLRLLNGGQRFNEKGI